MVHPACAQMLQPRPSIDKSHALSIHDDIYGTRNVSYLTTASGLAIIDGDVIYGTIDQLRSHSVASVGNDKRAFSLGSTGLWPNANLQYKFDSAATEALLLNIVDSAIARWTSGSPWFTFTRLPNSNAPQNGVITITANPCGGCNAHIGWANSARSMNLERSCPEDPGRGACGVSEAAHEFGHALGFYHEHQRPNRENTVNYQCANLAPNCPAGVNMPNGKTCCDSGLPSGCCSNSHNFAVVNSGSVDASGRYDVGSIMQYRADAFAISGRHTLTPAISGITIPTSNPSNPSAQDSTRLCKMYRGNCPLGRMCTANGCPTHCAIMTQCNNPHLCNSDYAPPCCDPDYANERCLEQRALCSSLGCDGL